MEKKATEKKAAPLTEEQLSQKEADLKAFADSLTEETKKLEANKEEFKNHIESETKKLTEGFKDLQEKEKAFEEKISQYTLTPEIEEKVVEPLIVTFDDEDYQFAEDAPELILFDGKAWTHQEIADNKDVLLQIIGGGLGLISKI